MKTPINDALKRLEKKAIVPFHMPGHKRNYGDIFNEIGKYDITEITGYDNLHCPEGIIRDSMAELQKVYGTEKSWYLINGSTCGIQASIASVCKPGDEIIIGRNCHKAVYHMIKLLHLKAFYLMPELSPDYHLALGMEEKAIQKLQRLVTDHDIKAVVLTSPTYEGVVTDIQRFRDVLKDTDICLIVDEAHGAHFVYHNYFPQSAVEQGADLVIQSTHKTLPALTQTALLHLCRNNISKRRIDDFLAIFETSSPSYLLMASAEYGVSYMENNVDKLQQYVDNLKKFITKCGQLNHIVLLDKERAGCFDFDRGKLVFLLKNTSMRGIDLFEKLYEDYHIELEMANAHYCVAMTSVMDTGENFNRLFVALYEIDKELSRERIHGSFVNGSASVSTFPWNPEEEKVMESWECEQWDQEEVFLAQSVGRISCSFVSLYPPGIPILVPGEKILKEMVENIKYYLYNGYNVTGLEQDKITVIK